MSIGDSMVEKAKTILKGFSTLQWCGESKYGTETLDSRHQTTRHNGSRDGKETKSQKQNTEIQPEEKEKGQGAYRSTVHRLPQPHAANLRKRGRDGQKIRERTNTQL